LRSNQSVTWSDEAFGATEFLFADYRDLVLPAHVHETFTIGVIEVGDTASGLAVRPRSSSQPGHWA
jgi:hypothetical protein